MTVETGPNASTIVDRARVPRIVGAEQDRLEEGAAGDAGRGVGIAGDDPRAGGDQLADLAADVVALGVETSAPMRVSLSRGSPTLVPWSRSRIAASTASRCSAGAMARRIAVHFCPALTVISVTTSLTNRSNSGRSRRGVGAEQRGVEAVLLGDELDAFALHDGVRAELERGRGRAGEADDVLPGQMVEQVADAADDQLDRSGRQQPASIITRNAASHR